MRVTLAILIGATVLAFLAGLVAAIPIRRALIRYSEHSLPKPDHTGPKVIMWRHGIRTERVGHTCWCGESGLSWPDAVTHCDPAAWGEDADEPSIIRGDD